MYAVNTRWNAVAAPTRYDNVIGSAVSKQICAATGIVAERTGIW